MIRKVFSLSAGATALVLLGACDTGFEMDLRGNMGGLDTSGAAARATADKPGTDTRGVISYPSYQVAVARRGDTVAQVADRVGLDRQELARFNGLQPDDRLRPGEVLALPRRVPEPGQAQGEAIDVSALASGAIDRAAPSVEPPQSTPAPSQPVRGRPEGPEPVRHKVERGETAYSISRLYDIPVRSLADWNGLGPDLDVREGQFLLIPVATTLREPARETDGQGGETEAPGQGSEAPSPPSASTPLPRDDSKVSSSTLPASPDLGRSRTSASRPASLFQAPVDGPVIRAYAKGRNEGIDLSAAPGTPVLAAADGEVAAITRDTDQVPILVLRHKDGLLTVYANIDRISVKKGTRVKRGQAIAVVRTGDPGFVHFEVRNGFESVDPAPYLK